jgi:hypothetical protein
MTLSVNFEVKKIGRQSSKSQLTFLFYRVSYVAEVAPPDMSYIFNSSLPAVQAVQNPWSIKAHSYSLHFHCALTTFCLNHRGA